MYLAATLVAALLVAVEHRPLAAETLSPILVNGAPRTYQVVFVKLPDELPKDIEIVADIIPVGDFSVLAPTRKIISPSSQPRRIAITIAIPSRALAGQWHAAEIRFHVGDGREFTLPVDVNVTVVRQIGLRTSAVPLMTQRGGVVIIPYTVANEGNIPESVTVALLLPQGWPSSAPAKRGIIVRPGETVDQQLRLRIPERSATGSVFLGMRLNDADETRRSAQVAVEVLDAMMPGNGAGPEVGTSFSRVSEGVGGGTLLDVSLRGPLFDSVRVDARFTHAPAMTGSASQALSRLGMYQGMSYVVLSSPSSKLGLGATGASLSELTGKYLYGQGAVYETNRQGWSVIAIGASSMRSQETDKRHALLGVRGEMQTGPVRISSSISHLEEGDPSARRLSAIGLGASAPLLYQSVVSAEVAHRSYTGGSGYGWTGALERNDTGNSARIAVTHAPGGSEAFARSSNEIAGNLSQRLTQRASISAAAWRVSDPNRVFTSVLSDGWSLRPEYRVFSATTMAVEAGSYGFNAVHRNVSTVASSFGSREQHAAVDVSSSVGRVNVHSAVSFGTTNRVITTFAQGTVEDRSPKIGWSALASWSGDRGTLQLNGNLDETRDRRGVVHRQGAIGVRADQMRAPFPLQGVRFDAEVQSLTGYQGGGAYMLRGGMAIPVADRFNVKLSVERNPLLQISSTNRKWIFAGRIEHALRMPMLRAPSISGYVYRDLNGNQRRDAGEPGVPNAVVRQGTVTAVTDSGGKYRVAGNTHEALRLDDASIPDRWLLEKTTGPDIGLSAAAVAAVELVIVSRSGVRAPGVDLASTRVLARDSVGRQWIARMSGPTTATFDALPVGDYDLAFDLSDLSERLTPRGEIPRLHVAVDSRTTLTVFLESRPLKLWTRNAGSPR